MTGTPLEGSRNRPLKSGMLVRARNRFDGAHALAPFAKAGFHLKSRFEQTRGGIGGLAEKRVDEDRPTTSVCMNSRACMAM